MSMFTRTAPATHPSLDEVTAAPHRPHRATVPPRRGPRLRLRTGRHDSSRTSTTTYVLTVALAVALVALAIAGGTARSNRTDQRQAPARTLQQLPPCPHEDSPGPCEWHADRQGIPGGTSFRVDADGTVTPLTHA